MSAETAAAAEQAETVPAKEIKKAASDSGKNHN